MIDRCLAGLARVVAGTTVCWAEEPNTTPKIYIANHSSHLDFIVLWSLLPPDVRERTRPVAAADYWNHGVKRYLADHAFHAVLISRGGASPAGRADAMANGKLAVEQMVAALDTGSSLILFPEGTRDAGGELSSFRSGLYFVCKERPDIPVVPVYMANLNRIMPKGALLPAPLLSRIVMGKPFQMRPEESKNDFLARSRTAVQELVAA